MGGGGGPPLRYYVHQNACANIIIAVDYKIVVTLKKKY